MAIPGRAIIQDAMRMQWAIEPYRIEAPLGRSSGLEELWVTHNSCLFKHQQPLGHRAAPPLRSLPSL